MNGWSLRGPVNGPFQICFACIETHVSSPALMQADYPLTGDVRLCRCLGYNQQLVDVYVLAKQGESLM